ncbi:MAG: Gx transporter family protein [Clostridiales bacterium]|nr:Gx transporter family protein [Clostridiales bacterium]
MKITTKKIALIGILISQAMILGFIERFIPIGFIVPGVKLGLSNIVTLISLYMLTFRETSLVLFGRIILLSFMFGSMSSLLYSLSGGIFALLVMALCMKIDKFSIIGISVLGAIAHNLGQLLMAALIISNLNIFYYLPLLMVFAIPTGLLIGTTSKLLLEFIQRNIDLSK